MQAFLSDATAESTHAHKTLSAPAGGEPAVHVPWRLNDILWSPQLLVRTLRARRRGGRQAEARGAAWRRHGARALTVTC